MKQWAATHQWCYWQHPKDREERDRLFQWPCVETASIASSLNVPPPSIALQWTQSLKKGPKSQRLLMQFFEGIASITSHRKRGNLQGSSCSHCQDIPCSTLPMCGSLQKEKQVIPRCPPRSKSSPALPADCLHHRNIGQLWPLLLVRIPPPSTF